MSLPRKKRYSGSDPCKDCDLYVMCSNYLPYRTLYLHYKRQGDTQKMEDVEKLQKQSYNLLGDEAKMLIDVFSDCMHNYPNYRYVIPESVSIYSKTGHHIATFDSFGSMLKAWGVLAIFGLLLALILG